MLNTRIVNSCRNSSMIAGSCSSFYMSAETAAISRRPTRPSYSCCKTYIRLCCLASDITAVTLKCQYTAVNVEGNPVLE